MTALAFWQSDFACALLTTDPATKSSPALARLVAQPGFAVYRNTVLTGCIEALQANFPSVQRLVGEEWFRAAAATYARSHLPRDPTLLNYGADFGDFLAAFEPARDLVYLPNVARVDRMWTEAHIAADDATASPSALMGLDEADLGTLSLRPHPAARWAWFDDQPIHTIWHRNRHDGANHSGPIEWIGEGVLVTRPDDVVLDHAIGRAGIALLDACAAGLSIPAAIAAALDTDRDADVAAVIGLTLRAGAFAGLPEA